MVVNVIVGGRLFYWLLDHPRKLVTLNPKLKSTGAGRYQLLSRWWDAYRKQLGLKDFSPKSQDAVALQQIKGVALFYMIDRGDIRQAIDRCSNIWSFFLRAHGYGQFEHKADSLIAKFKAGGTVRDWCMSRVTAIISLWLSASSSACHGLLIITIDNAIAYKAQRIKNARELKLANGNYWHADASAWCCCARCKIHEELADAKAENDALRDDVAAGRRRLHIKAVCQSVREATTASGVDNAASPRLADTAERDYFTLRERLITMQKQLEGTQKYINEQCR